MMACPADAVNGLTKADLADAPTVADLWPQVRASLRGARVPAYNAEFDRRMLAQSAERHDLKRPAWHEWVCLMELCAALDIQEQFNGRWVSLTDVCWWLKIMPGGHRALGDAQAALAVLRELAHRAPAAYESCAQQST
jgi:DNA polymerase III subunit epsilon